MEITVIKQLQTDFSHSWMDFSVAKWLYKEQKWSSLQLDLLIVGN